jgi:hypothetical protein
MKRNTHPSTWRAARTMAYINAHQPSGSAYWRERAQMARDRAGSPGALVLRDGPRRA